MEFVTCATCENTIKLISDGKVRFCKCKLLGVDHTHEYTRYLGSIPKESPLFDNWWRKHSKSCLKYRESLISESVIDSTQSTDRK